MEISIDELERLAGFVKSNMISMANRWEHEIGESMLRDIMADIEFRQWIKHHYPEALAEWNALNKMKGE